MKYKKIIASIVILITVLFIFAPMCFAAEDELDFKKMIKKEERIFI